MELAAPRSAVGGLLQRVGGRSQFLRMACGVVITEAVHGPVYGRDPEQLAGELERYAAGVQSLVAPSPEQPSTLRTCRTLVQAGREDTTTMLAETGARSSTLREPDVATLRRRLLVARHQVAHVEASAAADCQGALAEARRTYVADVEALLEDRRELLESIAALRRVAVAAEAALAESRAGQQAKRAADLVRALEVAGYAQASAAARRSV
jgi:hypothetical protein